MTQRHSNKFSVCKVQPLYLFLVATTLISLEVVLVYHRLNSTDPPRHGGPGDGPWINPEESSLESTWQPRRAPTLPTPLPPRTTKAPAGFLNGYPLDYQDLLQGDDKKSNEAIWSQMHCIGETFADLFHYRRKRRYLDLNWMTRSCHFQFLCFDTTENDFVVFFPPPQEQQQQQQRPHPHPPTEHHYYASTVFTNSSSSSHFKSTVSMGGINSKWGHEGIPKLEWFPRVVHQSPTQFYTLPANVTLIPFHSLAAFNPGHLVWDDFLPIFTLMQIFLGSSSPSSYNHNLNNYNMELLLLRYILPGNSSGLWAGCDWREDRQEDCRQMLKKFGPLMLGLSSPSLPITTQQSMRLEFTTTATTTGNTTMADSDNKNHHHHHKSKYICARHALAGIGALTDHGTKKLHGWEPADYGIVYNAGRGGQLWRFRNFMLANLGFIPKDENGTTMVNAPPPMPFVILISEASSNTESRNINFDAHVQALNESPQISSRNVEIKRVRMKDYSLTEQADMVLHTAIYVTACGGGAVSATFLPRGSSIIVFYSEVGGATSNRANGAPARLDWDYLNNMAYTRVHWVTKPEWHEHGASAEELELFVELVTHELDVMTIQRQQWDKSNGKW